MNTPIFEENDLENFKGIDIMRAVRSFDPCLPCGVHMYLGKGKTAASGCTRRPRSPIPPSPADRRSPPGRIRSGGPHATAEPSGGRRPDRAAARRVARRRRPPIACDRRGAAAAGDRALRRRGSSGSCSSRPRTRRRSSAVSSTTNSSPACSSCTACTPIRRARVERALGVGAAVPRRARRRRRAARHRRGTPARCTCDCSAAATAARRRRTMQLAVERRDHRGGTRDRDASTSSDTATEGRPARSPGRPLDRRKVAHA